VLKSLEEVSEITSEFVELEKRHDQMWGEFFGECEKINAHEGLTPSEKCSRIGMLAEEFRQKNNELWRQKLDWLAGTIGKISSHEQDPEKHEGEGHKSLRGVGPIQGQDA
jgi:hypothetical protein